jgi:hypothetical protein
VSQSYVIYYFEKCVIISWNCNTSFENQILEENFEKSSIYLFFYYQTTFFTLKKKIKYYLIFISHQSLIIIIIIRTKIKKTNTKGTDNFL